MLDAGKISRAVTDCLNVCYASSSPLGAVAQYVGSLSHDADWTAYEVEAVEIRVLRVLNRIVCQSDEKHEDGPRSVSVTVNPQNFLERQSQKPVPSPDP
jgi:hypothetical protein